MSGKLLPQLTRVISREKTIHKRSKPDLDKIEHQKKSIDELYSLIAGAIRESAVEKEIQKLSDDYTHISLIQLLQKLKDDNL